MLMGVASCIIGGSDEGEECKRNNEKVQFQAKRGGSLVLNALDMFEQQCDENGLADESVLQLDVAVLSREEVVEVEMELAELLEDFPAKDVAEPNE